jgi:hypothetical protein
MDTDNTGTHGGEAASQAAPAVAVWDYRIPESRSAFCNIVSLTAAKTKRMFPVSVACVKLRTAMGQLASFLNKNKKGDVLRVDA